MSSDEYTADEQQEPKTVYSVEGSYIYHENRDCHHLDNANEVEEITEDEGGRRCNQCAYDALSYEEKRRRRRRSRRKRTTTIKIRR